MSGADQELASWNQAKAYHRSIRRYLDQADYYSTNEHNFKQWADCLLTVYRAIYPYIIKDKNEELVDELRTIILKLRAKPYSSPHINNKLWFYCDKFQRELNVIMESRGLLMAKDDDWEESEA